MAKDKRFSIADLRHPSIGFESSFWYDWRTAYDGGDYYLDDNLIKFSEREDESDFLNRRLVTPVPAYAKAAVNDVRNSVFQRMCDITRKGGSDKYRRAVAGELGGVDMKGTSMNAFIGMDVLTELLVMGRVGVFVDSPRIAGATLADVGGKRPYLYRYRVEDILSWSCTLPEEPNKFQAVLLRDKGLSYGCDELEAVDLPSGEYERYRLMWINKDTGFVNVQFYNLSGAPIESDGTPQGVETPTVLELRSIPFVMFDIGDSLLKDTIGHQRALLNLTSSDVSYALRANFPFYVEQQDMRAVGDHLKNGVSEDGSAMSGGQGAKDKQMNVGPTHGRVYDIKAQAPEFIHPSSEPLLASLQLQEKLEDDIRKLVNLAVQNKVGRRSTSAEAKKLSDQGLEAGLSFIGLALEQGERNIASHWASYEERQIKKRVIATIKYPDRYSLKTDADRVDEADKLSELMFTVPGTTVKKELAKGIASALLGGKISVDSLEKIFAEIDDADYTTSDPDIIIRSNEAGLVGDETASEALGFGPEEFKKAREDHAARVQRLLKSQSSGEGGGEGNLGARGAPDLAANADEGVEERAQATDTTLSESKRKPVRGKGKQGAE
jgi:hypothetical protein